MTGQTPSTCFGFFEPTEVTKDRNLPQKTLVLTSKGGLSPGCRNSAFVHQANKLTLQITDGSGKRIGEEELLARFADAGTYVEYDGL